MTEWHPRYRGPGVMIYWHVEDKFACIHSQLKTCTSSEVAAMIKELLQHATEKNVDRNYVDTHGQSEVGFAFFHLEGKELPRHDDHKNLALYWSSCKRTDQHQVDDVNFQRCQIRVNQGKGNKDRIVPFPSTFKELLAMHATSLEKKKATYLFESSWRKKYSDRGVRKILKNYSDQAGIEYSISPHKLRHFLLTWLKKPTYLTGPIDRINLMCKG